MTLFIKTSISYPAATVKRLLSVHTDRIGSPTEVTRKTKALQWSTSYQPYGQTVNLTNPGSISQYVALPGMLQDAEISNVHNGYRDYMPGATTAAASSTNDPTGGRYFQADPIGLEGGLNPYRYANANPLSYIDPTGENFVTTLAGENPIVAGGQSAIYIYNNGGAAIPAAQTIITCLQDPFCAGNVIDNLGGATGDVIRDHCPWLDSILNNDEPVYPDNPDENPEKYRRIKGSKAKENTDDDSVWEPDTSGHGGDQWKRWPGKRQWNNGDKPQSIWPDGRIRK